MPKPAVPLMDDGDPNVTVTIINRDQSGHFNGRRGP
jgi:hypothetical protein